MNRIAGLCFTVISLTCFTGCPSLVQITNHGPNPVTITSVPSPVDPEFPLTIPVGESRTIDWALGPVNITGVDMVVPASQTLNNFDIDRGAISIIDLEWTGTEFIDHGVIRQAAPGKARAAAGKAGR